MNAILKSAIPQLLSLLSTQGTREVIMAAHGRKVARLCVAEHLVHKIVELLDQAGLWVDLHDMKQIFQADSGKGGWISGYGIEVPVDSHLNGYVLLYAANDPAKVREARRAEHSNQARRFGELLGYPTCCINFYTKHLEQAEAAQGDFILPLLEESVKTHPETFPVLLPWLNIAAQYFNASLLSFYPCSFFCAAATQISRDTLALMKQYDEPWAEQVLDICRTPIVYTEYEGIYLLKGARKEGNMLYYPPEQMECSLDGVLAGILARGSAMRLISAQEAIVYKGDVQLAHLKSSHLALLAFS